MTQCRFEATVSHQRNPVCIALLTLFRYENAILALALETIPPASRIQLLWALVSYSNLRILNLIRRSKPFEA